MSEAVGAEGGLLLICCPDGCVLGLLVNAASVVPYGETSRWISASFILIGLISMTQ